MTKQTAKLDIRLSEKLKAEALAASQEIRGGLSRVVRDLLAAWLEKQKRKRVKT